jgi:TatD DNase family protein
MWIDSHCHLNHAKIQEAGSPDALITRAKEQGIDGMMTICCRIAEELPGLLDIANAHENVWCSVGTHPHDAQNEAEKAISADDIISLCQKHEKIIGVGEAGLDYFYDNSPRAEQQESFRKQIRAAKAAGLPLIIHTREAEEDTYAILEEEGACDGTTKVLMHCYSSNSDLAEKCIKAGFYFSFSGMITFKKNEELREIAKQVPLVRVLVETDAPYLAPEPHRGKTNEPAFVRHTGQYMADLYNLTEKEFAACTSENFFRLFSKASKKA